MIKSSRLLFRKLRSSSTNVGMSHALFQGNNGFSDTSRLPDPDPTQCASGFLLRVWHFRAVMWKTLPMQWVCLFMWRKATNVGCGDVTWNISEYFEKSEMLPIKWKFNQIYETQQNEVSFWWFIVQCINARFLVMRNALLRFQSIGMRCTNYIWTAESFSKNTAPRTKTYYELCSVCCHWRRITISDWLQFTLSQFNTESLGPPKLQDVSCQFITWGFVPFLIKLGHW